MAGLLKWSGAICELLQFLEQALLGAFEHFVNLRWLL